MEKEAPKTTNDIVIQKPLGAPKPFKLTAKHVKREHVEEKVGQAPVHEHMGNDLPRHEKGRAWIGPGEPRNGHFVSQKHGCTKKQNVDDDEVADNHGGVFAALFKSLLDFFHLKGSDDRLAKRV